MGAIKNGVDVGVRDMSKPKFCSCHDASLRRMMVL